MGLLDNLQLGHGANFGGGLLDFLRTTQMQNQQYQPSAGFGQNPMDANAQMQAPPLAIGSNYQMPRIGGADQFTPEQVNIPQNAQPAQGQLPQQAPQMAQESPGGFGAGLQGFLQNLHTGPIGALAGAVGGAAGIQSPERQQANQTAQFLVSKGMDPAMAKSVVSDPALLRSVLPQIMGMGGQTDDIKEYQFAKKEDPTLTFNKFMSQKKAVSGEYGMQPIWGMKDGKPSIIQLGKSGEAKESVLPQGFSPARDPVKVEGPTGTTILDPQTRQIIQFIPKDVSGAAKAKEIGEAEGQATVNLPTAIATAENTLKTIKQLEEHPGKKSWGAFGVGAMLPDVPGTATRGFASLVDQVKGQNFMTAFQSLKGAGAITEQEGAKAEKAQARLDRAQSEADFDIALKDLKDVVAAGMARARQKAGQGGQASPAPAPPSGGNSVDALLKKYGG
jgi:hypothetical protein